ncbi:unnamed protein product, partial [Mesorhabditis spiculigera]
MAITAQQIIEIILCILLPPLAVFMHANECNIHVLISAVLMLLGYFLSPLHAIWYCFFPSLHAIPTDINLTFPHGFMHLFTASLEKMAITAQQIIELILCIFLPPLAVFLHGNDCNAHVLINIVLFCLGYILAPIHAIWYCFFQ